MKKSKNISWSKSRISKKERECLLKQKGCVIWITGLPSSGKSTIAKELERQLLSMGNLPYILDGDNLRHGLNSDLGFSPEDRAENIRRAGELALLFADAGLITICAFISPYRKDRDKIRSLAPKGRFIEVFLSAPLEICEKRDPKKLYIKARKGEITDFTGISAPYEAPLHPEIILKTDRESPESAAGQIVDFLKRKQVIQ